MNTASVMKSGNSAVIALPSAFRRQCGIEVGDRVAIEYPDETTMIVRPLAAVQQSREDALVELLALVDAQPAAAQALPYADGREGVRDVLEERYA